jgi:alkylation response protein AidB-like acyl-CoA dehydrogenase
MNDPANNAIPTLAEMLQAVERISPTITRFAEEAEQRRRLPQPVVDAMRDAGLFRLWAPKAFGGYEYDPVSAFRIFEAIAKVDSAAGWNLQLSSAIHPFIARLPDTGAAEIFEKGPDQIMGGALFPPGKATPVKGGYTLSGRWPFVSGCHQCAWFMAPSFVMEAGLPKLHTNGEPVQILVFFSSEKVEIVDTWHTMGMRGTGSHDIIAKEIFVPTRRTAPMAPLENTGKAYRGGLYRLSVWSSLAALAPPALGVASAAISSLIELAKQKTPFYTTRPLRERVEAQSKVAQAEAMVGAGRAYLYEAVQQGMALTATGEPLPLAQKMKIQLATTYAIQSAANAVDIVHSLAGSSAIRKKYKFQQYFRDIHTITQHAHSSTARYQNVGNLMFGLDMDWPFFAL